MDIDPLSPEEKFSSLEIRDIQGPMHRAPDSIQAEEIREALMEGLNYFLTLSSFFLPALEGGCNAQVSPWTNSVDYHINPIFHPANTCCMVSMLTRGWTYCVMTEVGEGDIKDKGLSTGARSFRVLLETP